MRPFGEPHGLFARFVRGVRPDTFFFWLHTLSDKRLLLLLRVDEQQIKFRLDSHPVLELPIVNASDKTLVGDFRLELLDSKNKVESFVTGKFQEKPGTTVEKVDWPLDYLVNISPSSLGWRRLHYSFVQRPELGVAPVEGFVQLSRTLLGVFEVRMTAASKAKPGNSSLCVFALMTQAMESLCVGLLSTSRWSWETMMTTR